MVLGFSERDLSAMRRLNTALCVQGWILFLFALGLLHLCLFVLSRGVVFLLMPVWIWSVSWGSGAGSFVCSVVLLGDVQEAVRSLARGLRSGSCESEGAWPVAVAEGQTQAGSEDQCRTKLA